MRLALAADDEGKAAAVAFTARQHARRGPALALLQQLDLALLHLGAAARLDGAHVGVVDPGEAAVLAAQPNGDGKRIEQRAAGAHLACEALVLGEDAGDLVAMPGHVAETQHGATAGRAPLGFEVTAGHGAHDEVERVSRGEQRVEGRFQRRGRARLQPLAEAHEFLRRIGEARNTLQRMGDDAQRLVLLPEQQDLRLGADDGIGGGEAALEAARFDDGAALIALGAHHRQPDQRARRGEPTRR